MSTTIYSLFVIKNNVAANLANKAMAKEEQDLLWKTMSESLDKAGAQSIVTCESAFANEETPYWGVIKYPSLQARIDQTHAIQEMGWTNLTDAFTLLGTAISEPIEVTVPNPIYKLWVIKTNPAGFTNVSTMPKGIDSLMWEKHNALMKECNSQNLLMCDSYWANEEYSFFGVDAYPDTESMITIQKGLVELGWQRYFEAFTILGKAWM